MCRSSARRQSLAWVAVILVGIGYVCANARYARNFVEGPFPEGADHLANISDLDATSNYFVSVTGEKVLDTGIQEITTTTTDGVKDGSYVSAGYYAFLIGDRVLIVKTPSKPGSTVSGELLPIPSDLSNELFSGADGQELRRDAYPFYMSTTGFREPGYWAIGIGCALFLLFLKFGVPAIRHWADVSKHPVVKRVNQHWGNALGVSLEAERELNSGVVYKAGGVFLTNGYVIQKTFFTFNIHRFHDLLWAYKKVTQRRVNFIPTGKSYGAVLVFYGGSEAASASEAEINEILVFAQRQAPWAVLGYTEELKRLFTKNTREFCEAVEDRRRRVTASVL